MVTHHAAGVASRHQRVQSRKEVGPLKKRIVKDRTKKAYDKACLWFFRWVVAWGIQLPSELWGFDDLVCTGIECLWEEGENRSVAGNLISGLQHATPPLAGCLKGSWRLWNAWGRAEIPMRAPPLTWEMTKALSYVMLRWDCMDCALLLLIGFLSFLRTSEFLSIRRQDLTFAADLSRVHITLPMTKGVSRSGGVESVYIADKDVVKALYHFCSNLLPGDSILRRTGTQFRKIFAAAVLECSLDSGVRPYSLRRGGATYHFRRFGNMDKTMEIGRWQHQKTARVYVNSALAELAVLHLPAKASSRVAEWSAALSTVL